MHSHELKGITVAFKLIPNTTCAIALDCFGREFFYNVATKQSSWELDIETRMQLDMILASNDISSSTDENELNSTTITDSTTDSDSDSDSYSNSDSDSDSVSHSNSNSISLEKKQTFFSLLKEFNVSPAALWDDVVNAVGNDSRFKDVPEHSRENLFFEYCRTAQAVEKKQTLKTTNDSVQKLLQMHIPNKSASAKWTLIKFYKAFKRELVTANIDLKQFEILYRQYLDSLDSATASSMATAKANLEALFRETKDINAQTKWSEVPNIINQTDKRWTAITNHMQKQSIYWNYIKNTK